MSRYEPKRWVMVKDKGHEEWSRCELLADLGDSIKYRYVCRLFYDKRESGNWEQMRNLTGKEWTEFLPEWIRERLPEYDENVGYRTLASFFISLPYIKGLPMTQIHKACKGECDWPDGPIPEFPWNGGDEADLSFEKWWESEGVRSAKCVAKIAWLKGGCKSENL